MDPIIAGRYNFVGLHQAQDAVSRQFFDLLITTGTDLFNNSQDVQEKIYFFNPHRDAQNYERNYRAETLHAVKNSDVTLLITSDDTTDQSITNMVQRPQQMRTVLHVHLGDDLNKIETKSFWSTVQLSNNLSNREFLLKLAAIYLVIWGTSLKSVSKFLRLPEKDEIMVELLAIDGLHNSVDMKTIIEDDLEDTAFDQWSVRSNLTNRIIEHLRRHRADRKEFLMSLEEENLPDYGRFTPNEKDRLRQALVDLRNGYRWRSPHDFQKKWFCIYCKCIAKKYKMVSTSITSMGNMLHGACCTVKSVVQSILVIVMMVLLQLQLYTEQHPQQEVPVPEDPPQHPQQEQELQPRQEVGVQVADWQTLTDGRNTLPILVWDPGKTHNHKLLICLSLSDFFLSSVFRTKAATQCVGNILYLS